MAKILAIETSCDETAVAIVEEGQRILTNQVASQVETHARFGGVVPEIASRQHLLTLNPLIRRALSDSGLDWPEIDALAVTQGPGLVGALLIGVTTAKAIAWALGKPLVAVNHMAGHIYANMLAPEPPQFPLLCLVVSGGHTELIYMEKDLEFQTLGATRDDAAGEAYDKVARILDLGYPGGPAVDKLAGEGRPVLDFPRVLLEPETLDFSFSGLKTAVMNYVHNCRQRGISYIPANVAASFQAAVVDVLVEKTARAVIAKRPATLCLAGGVAANSSLRTALAARAAELGVPLTVPPLSLCTDNAAMISAAAWPLYQRGEFGDSDLNAVPGLNLTDCGETC
ncbi:MAG: tRNA (adenosine(37)-N6)-threonylcarbamoyltransferase complex transferase subunit TsaD [Firmicutes bacterium]|nr:tRNA (adenosine(37)-N6)-threonylcarbamoyltransferase complex transferase subunit TsaD [Bacillota bacterium]